MQLFSNNNLENTAATKPKMLADSWSGGKNNINHIYATAIEEGLQFSLKND